MGSNKDSHRHDLKDTSADRWILWKLLSSS